MSDSTSVWPKRRGQWADTCDSRQLTRRAIRCTRIGVGTPILQNRFGSRLLD